MYFSLQTVSFLYPECLVHNHISVSRQALKIIEAKGQNIYFRIAITKILIILIDQIMSLWFKEPYSFKAC